MSVPAGNLGMLLRPTLPMNNATMTYRFASANHSDPAWRPRLVVTYTGGQAHNPGRLPGHASLAQQPAPEATPPANHTWRSYYHAAGRRVAMRVQDGTTGANQVHYLFADHLGSTNVTYNTATSTSTTQRYYPWGAVRPGPSNALPTGYTYTGQLDTGLGLMYYAARFYDGYLNRWIQPDTIVPDPGNPQSLNRYSYVLNNPLRYSDSSGHCGPLTPVCVILALLGTGLLLSGDDTSQPVSAEVANSARLGGALLVTTVGVGSGSAIVGSATAAGAATTGAGAACADGDCTNEAQTAARALQSVQQAPPGVSQTAYEVASNGGRHAGFLRQYAERSIREITKAAESLQQRANQHIAKLGDPAKYAGDQWNGLTEAQRQGLLRYWEKEAQTYQEQADILFELLRRVGGQ